MSDERKPNQYEALNETHRQVHEEEEKRRTAEAEKEANSPEAHLAAMEAELAEKVRLGRISKGEMNYLLSRFDNQLVTEMNVEDAQKARDAAAFDRATPNDGADQSRDNDNRSGGEKEAGDQEHEFMNRGEMTEARSARLARLRTITQELARDQPERDGNESDLSHESGDRSR